MMPKRTYISELVWALEQIAVAINSDRNRQAQLRTATDYGLAVAAARRSRGQLPRRPDVKGAV